MEYAIFVLEYLKSDYNKIITTRSVYTKLIGACSRKTLENYVNQLFSMMPQTYKINNPLYYSAFMNGLYDDFSQMHEKNNNSNNNGLHLTMTLNEKESLKRANTYLPNYHISKDFLPKRSIKNLINSSIFVPYNYCNYCFNNDKLKKINYCDVIAGFERNIDSEFSVCNVCLNKYNPLLYILFEDETKLENVEVIKLLSPMRLISEIDEIIKNEGEKCFFLTDYYLRPKGKIIFYNILFYFEIFGLPNIVMILHQDSQALRNEVDDLMLGIQNVKKFSLDRKNSNNYSSVQLKTLVNLTESEINGEDNSNNNSFRSDDNDNDNYNKNEKKLDEKM
jgi:hypothetical protein